MIELEALTRMFNGQTAVDGVNLRLGPGELMVLLGPSGCGKTTTLKMINRLVRPSSGRVLLDGVDASTIPTVELRRSIGYVFQGIGLFPHMTVARNVGIVGELLVWQREDRDRRVDELLELVGLSPDEFRARKPATLSGGQQQRVGIARALFARPRVMLLDEPFGALDPLTRDRLQQEFRRIQQSLGVTALLVTHDVVEALLLADRVAVMHHGRIVQCGTGGELLRAPRNEFVASLMETPRRQAGRLDDLLADGSSPSLS
ncbi:MAG: ABC transporter ATP-binding protein [Acidobacteriota bacterium]